MNGFKKKDGSFIVFALMVFSAVMIMIAALISASIEFSVHSAVDSFGTLWGKNILGQYDLYLKERYGILGFYGNNHSVTEDLKFYTQYSFEDKEYIDLGDMEAKVSQFPLTSTTEMENQITDAVLSGLEPHVEEGDEEIEEKGRYIDSEWIIKSLPSYGLTEEVYITGLIKQIKAGIGAASLIKQLAIDKYIFTFFKDYMEDRDLGNTYFANEIEYIISGELSDEEALKSVETKIKVMRNLLNLYYLYSCPEKRQGAMALAETLTPGPAAVLTQAVILETWAYAEAENDINILYEGETVPLLKNDSNWALALDNVFNDDGTMAEDETKKKYIVPDKMEGEKYETYLAILLCGMTKETKLLRIMDLIQINGKYVYCNYFLLGDYCYGLEYEIDINGKNHRFRDEY